jgi:hypothetical protein
VAAASLSASGALLAACFIDLPRPLDDRPDAGPGAGGGAVASSGAGATGAGGGTTPASPCDAGYCQGRCQIEKFQLAGSELSAIALNDSYVYVSDADGPSIVRFDKLSQGFSEFVNGASATDIAVDDSQVYWVNKTTVTRRPEIGGVNVTIDNAPGVRIAVDDTDVYWVATWASESGPCLMKAPKQGRVAPTTLHQAPLCVDLVLGADHVYVLVDVGRIIRAFPKASGSEPIEISRSGPQKTFIETDDVRVYFTTEGPTVGSISITDPDAGTSWLSETPFDLVRDPGIAPTTLFLTNKQVGGGIQRVTGASIFDAVTPADGSVPFRLAVDATHIYWTSRDEWLRRVRRCAP